MFQANYVSGVRVYNISDRVNVGEIMHYDTYQGPVYDGVGFHGMWGVYPYYQDPSIVVGSDLSCGIYSWKLSNVFPPMPSPPTNPPSLPPPSPPASLTCPGVRTKYNLLGCCSQTTPELIGNCTYYYTYFETNCCGV